MTSKQALNLLETRCRFFAQDKDELQETYEAREKIEQDLDRLEKLEKCIDILKDNLFIYKKDNYRLSVNGSLEYQEVTKQEYELLKEWLENE